MNSTWKPRFSHRPWVRKGHGRKGQKLPPFLEKKVLKRGSIIRILFFRGGSKKNATLALFPKGYKNQKGTISDW